MLKAESRGYNWRDIKNLIYNDLGLKTEQQRREYGEIWFKGELATYTPSNDNDIVVEARRYELGYSERLDECMGENQCPKELK